MNFPLQHMLRLINLLEDKGILVAPILRKLGLDLSALRKETQSLSEKQMEQIWEWALEQSQNPSLGLQLGEQYQLMAMGIVGNIAQHSPDIQTALQKVCEYSNILTQLFSISIHIQEVDVLIRFHPSPDCLSSYPLSTIQSLYTAMVFALKEYQILTFQKVQARWIGLAEAPVSTAEFDRIFQCPVRTSQAYYEICLAKDLLSQKIVGADYALLGQLVERAESLLQSRKDDSRIQSRIRRLLIQQIHQGFPTLEAVAAQLNLSIRSLQRKLLHEESSFKDILEEVKQDFAEYYLKRDISIKEIAFILGYQDLSSFSRSFKRWTGKSPSEFKDG